MTKITFVMPVAPYHTDVMQRALDSVNAQTVPVKCIYAIDHDKQGAGVIRNQLLEDVQTEYVSFLDADDWIDPTFAEQCLREIKPARYVYTDWYQDQKHVRAPDRAWCGGTWHVVTTLLNTQDVRNVGGFDEVLPALEDTDFYLKLVTRHICGIRISKPLFHYGAEGQRSKKVRQDGTRNDLRIAILERYRGKMGCCGDHESLDLSIPEGEQQPGDVLARALWSGNRKEFGRVSARRYPRMSYPKVAWVHPGDIDQRPDLWQRVPEPTIDDEQVFRGVGGFAEVLKLSGTLGTPQDYVATLAEQGDYAPAVDYVMDIAEKKLR